MKANIYSIIILLLLITFALFNTGCIITYSETPATPSETPTSIPPKSTPFDPDWTPPKYDSNALEMPSFASVIAKAYPSVVSINTETVTLDIFAQPRTQAGAGSGWVLDNINNHSYIVTNNHVVEGAKNLIIETFDGKTFEAGPSHVRRDAISDIALIELSNTILSPAKIGNSSILQVGDFVIALGNPLGQGLRAKEGTVSGLKVSLPVGQGQYLYDLIETSAAINPGNSGGPLINLASEVVGITSAKMAAVGVEGMGYAISIKAALPIIEQLITRGYVIRPYLGVATVKNNDYVAAVNRLSSSTGLVIAYVEPGGPASKAGLTKFDIITSFKDTAVNSPEELVQMIHASQIGEGVKITFVRGTVTDTTTAILIESPPPK